MSQTIEIIDLIKSCETEKALEFIEQAFVFTEEQKRDALQQRIVIWTNAMAKDIRREVETPVGVDPEMMAGWTDDERREFNEDWANDNLVIPDEEEPEQTEINEPMDEPLENQIGEGSKRKNGDDNETSTKRLKPEEYFTIKSVKQVNVRKFRTTGTDFTRIL